MHCTRYPSVSANLAHAQTRSTGNTPVEGLGNPDQFFYQGLRQQKASRDDAQSPLPPATQQGPLLSIESTLPQAQDQPDPTSAGESETAQNDSDSDDENASDDSQPLFGVTSTTQDDTENTVVQKTEEGQQQDQSVPQVGEEDSAAEQLQLDQQEFNKPIDLTQPTPIDAGQQQAIDKLLATSRTPEGKPILVPDSAIEFIAIYNPPDAFRNTLLGQSLEVQYRFSKWYKENNFPDISKLDIEQHLEDIINSVSDKYRTQERAPTPGTSKEANIVRAVSALAIEKVSSL